MERPTGIIFEGIGEDKPLWLDDLLIYASLSLYDPPVFVRGNVTAALALLREGGTSLGIAGMTVDELRKYPRRSHGYAPASPRPQVSLAGDHDAAVRAPPLHQTLWVGKCLKNEFARGVEDARDEKLTIGWFAALIRLYFFWHVASPSIELCKDTVSFRSSFRSSFHVCASASPTNDADVVLVGSGASRHGVVSVEFQV
jgi:hypothetical protein